MDELSDEIEIPLCPRCGTPARVVLVERAVIRLRIEADGTPGRVLSARGWAREAGYECGGGHAWEAEG